MSDNNRPRGREKNVTGQGKSVYKRGEGLGTGPVGSQSGYEGRPGTTGAQQDSRPQQQRTTRGGGKSLIAIILALLLGGGGGGALLSGLLGGGGSTQPSNYTDNYTNTTPSYTQQGSSAGSMADLTSLLSAFTSSGVSSGWGSTVSQQTSGSTGGAFSSGNNTGSLNTSVAAGSRAKRTSILGSGRDVYTIMVYMCGTDLESRCGMGTADLQEMASANIGDNVNLIVYTGGCAGWKNNVVSSRVNQVYQVKNGGLMCLSDNAGTGAMTDPRNLAAFIQFCTKNFPANRNALIFWDHGGGSLSGYGYDEKNKSAGSMDLAEINTALKAGGATFDFIGFDACLMATVETALTLTPYADYLIASEETEPGQGWYYTNWLTNLSRNTSMSTLEIGKNIIDDFVTVSAQKCPGQSTTLSVVDLAELEHTVPQELKDFAVGTSALIRNQQFQTVSNARAKTREFASSNRIDQVDLVHLAGNLGTQEGKDLANVLLSAVKYNRTSSNMTNAYGLSIYFPYQKASSVQTAVNTYQAIGMDEDYTRCIQQFASMEVSGQAVSGGASSPLGTLLSGYSSYPTGQSGSSSTAGADMISQMLSGLLGGNLSGVSGLTGSNSGFLGRSLDVDSATQFIAANQFDRGQMVWTERSDGTLGMYMSLDQWKLVQDLKLNVFIDDGEGYIDLGLDTVYEFTPDGALSGEYDGTWIAINDQPVAYYHVSTVDDGTNYSITGRVPVMINDVRADLILVFDNEHPYGFVAGARYDYRDGETETVAKSMESLTEGDRLDFLCDYYSYDGVYQDSYYLGDPMTVAGDLVISNVYIDREAASATYRFTDIYNQTYWSPVMR